MPFPNPDTQFKPGNRASVGRPNPSSVTAKLRALLEKVEADGRPVAEVVAEKIVESARAGDYQFVRELLDRTEGKPPQPVRHQGHDGGMLKVIVEYADRMPDDPLDAPEAACGPEEDPGGDDAV